MKLYLKLVLHIVIAALALSMLYVGSSLMLTHPVTNGAAWGLYTLCTVLLGALLGWSTAVIRALLLPVSHPPEGDGDKAIWVQPKQEYIDRTRLQAVVQDLEKELRAQNPTLALIPMTMDRYQGSPTYVDTSFTPGEMQHYIELGILEREDMDA